MNFENKKDKIKLSLKLMDKLSKNDFNEYWSGFNQAPLALYDKEEVYLMNHPNPPEYFEYKVDGLFVGKWTSDYVGNTAIKVNDTFTAIWDLTTLAEVIDVDDLYSCIVHEMFHANQLKNSDTRFSDELLFINYPFSPEFINLRLCEGELLLKILFENNLEVKKNLILNFINLRDERHSMIGDSINYEFGIESIEGTAVYAQFYSLLKESNLPKPYLVSTFGEKLIENNDLRALRLSCCYFGLFLALILDDFFDDWKFKYSTSSLYLYEFFKEAFKGFDYNNEPKFIPKDNIKYAEFLLSQYMDTKNSSISKFYSSTGYKIVLKGNFTLSGFDPMNITALNNKILHKNFLSLNNKIFIYTEVLSLHDDEIDQINEVQFYSNEKPSINDNTICIANVGKLSGNIAILDNTYTIELN